MHTALTKLLAEIEAYQKNNPALTLKYGGAGKKILFILYNKQAKPIERVASTGRFMSVTTKLFKLIRLDKQKKCAVFQPYWINQNKKNLSCNLTLSLSNLCGFYCFSIEKSMEEKFIQRKEEEKEQPPQEKPEKQQKPNPFTDILQNGSRIVHRASEEKQTENKMKTEPEELSQHLCSETEKEPEKEGMDNRKIAGDERDSGSCLPVTTPEKAPDQQPQDCKQPEKNKLNDQIGKEKKVKTGGNRTDHKVPENNQLDFKPCPPIKNPEKAPNQQSQDYEQPEKPDLNGQLEEKEKKTEKTKRKEPCSASQPSKKTSKTLQQTASCTKRIIPIKNIKSIEYIDK